MDIKAIQQKLTRSGLQQRDAQIDMIQTVYDALTQKKILCIEAPTGTGKTLSYCIASYYTRKADQPIVISTATVALQEQLVNKDLPLLSEILGVEIKYTLAKGRRRYVCLDRLYSPDAQPDLLRSQDDIEKVRQLIDQKRWNGDRDQLSFTVPDEQWQKISTDSAGCTGNLCDFYEECFYYKSRKKMHVSDFIVANHSLLLSDLELGGGAVLPEPENNLYIIDEAHHLPEKALDHCAKSASLLGAIEWINNLTRASTKALQSGLLQEAISTTLNQTTHDLVSALKQCHEFLALNSVLFIDGIWHVTEVDEALQNLAQPILHHSTQLTLQCNEIMTLHEQKLETMTSGDDSKTQLAKSLGNFTFLTDRANTLRETWHLFCHQREKNEAPIARWFEQHKNPYHDAEWNDTFLCHASPINVSQHLQTLLWEKIPNGILLCSATLRALGKFDDYRRKTGLKDHPRLVEKSIESFFNYTKSVLFIPSMQSEPSGMNQEAHRREVITLLPQLFLPNSGTLVLYTSQNAMETTYAQLAKTLQDDILMQGAKSKNRLIELHKERIRRGRRSILFGLASFGEGLDLPADFCEHVIIHKLPFGVPSTPIERTRNNWLEKNKLNPFILSALPAASIRLTQYVGRLLRQESDVGIVTILDKRLYSKGYGKQLLNNLPGFKRLINCSIEQLQKEEAVTHLFFDHAEK